MIVLADRIFVLGHGGLIFKGKISRCKFSFQSHRFLPINFPSVAHSSIDLIREVEQHGSMTSPGGPEISRRRHQGDLVEPKLRNSNSWNLLGIGWRSGNDYIMSILSLNLSDSTAFQRAKTREKPP